MKIRKLNFAKVSGIITGVMAIAMLLIDLAYETINFNTTMLVIVLGIAIVLITSKPKPTGEEIKLSSKQQLTMISFLIIGVATGIMAFVFAI
jgi:hypothetical protein